MKLKSLLVAGALLAASFTQSATQPTTLQLGIVNRVVQKTFKIESITNASKPRVVSTALVQINDYGEYVINAWEISSIDAGVSRAIGWPSSIADGALAQRPRQ